MRKRILKWLTPAPFICEDARPNSDKLELAGLVAVNFDVRKFVTHFEARSLKSKLFLLFGGRVTTTVSVGSLDTMPMLKWSSNVEFK